MKCKRCFKSEIFICLPRHFFLDTWSLFRLLGKLPRFVQGAVPDGMPKQRMRGAVPARGYFANPLPGGFGSPVDRHKDRSARSVLNRGIVFLSGWRNG